VIADSSLAAYIEIKNMPGLAPLQKRILEFLCEFPDRDFTRAEIANHLGMKVATVCGRINELLDLEQNRGRVWIESLPLRTCTIGGRSAHPVRIHRPAGQLSLFKEAA